LEQHALSPANALDEMNMAAATKAAVVILIMVNAQTHMHLKAFNCSSLENMAGANSLTH
jgi:hypothetical protein